MLLTLLTTTLLTTMKLTKTQRLILYSLGQFYKSINQPLEEKPVRLRTSKIAFIELILESDIITKQERALYKNLETLEEKKLIAYENKMIKFTEKGLRILEKINKEISQFTGIEKYFKEKKPKRKLQTVING
ncbi:MAG: hypothetical protein AB1668_07190 [Nanoarchaeota archaeon]